MSAPNFYNKNASRIFAAEVQEDYDYEDLKGNVRAELGYSQPEFSINDNCRSYPEQGLANIYKSFPKLDVSIDVVVRSGYYSGVNLDWELRVIEDGTEYERNEIKVPKYIDKWIDSQITKVEKVFTEFTTPLIKVGQFSNGEAVYKKA